MKKRILIVRTDRVGDTVMITAMPREIRKAFPDAYVGTLTRPNTARIFLNNPHVDVSITDDLAKDSFWKVVKEIRKHKFTHALVPLPYERDTYQVFLAGILRRIGSGHKLFQRITFMRTVSRNKYIPLRHEADYCMDLARAIGVETNNIDPEIFVTDTEKTEANKSFAGLGIAEADTKIIVHTGTGDSAPNWPEAKYADLITALARKYPQAKILLTANEMSASFRQQFKDQKSVIDVTTAGADLRDLIKIISVSDVLISSSTGPMHLASALSVPTVSIICHRPMSSAARWGALGSKAHNIEVQKSFCDKHCSPDKERCEIAHGISIEDVIKEVSLNVQAKK